MIMAIILGAALLFLTMVLPYISHSVLQNPSVGRGKIEISLYIILVALLASITQFTLGLKFYKSACKAFKHCSFTMDVLVVIGTTVAYTYGVVLIFLEKEKASEVH